MNTRQLGTTDLCITPFGLGTWAMGGGGYQFGWGRQDDSDSIATIHQALDLGINWIDTAAVYGLGHAEEVIGRALQSRQDRPLIFTKCSLVWNDQGRITHTMKEVWIRREVEASLHRLNTEVIDLYQLHWPDPESEIEEGWRTLAALQQEGKVRFIGVSNFTVEHMKRAQSIARIDSLQPPYSLIRPEIEESILPYCQEQQIGVIVY
jgi:aryl-alcohol dehydrogenase-like predicted oxidoreductase